MYGFISFSYECNAICMGVSYFLTNVVPYVWVYHDFLLVVVLYFSVMI
jgi:hypothetical protein